MISKQKVINSFSRQADNYDQYAVVQKHMAKSLITRLQNLSAVGSILEIGCGTGFFTRLLAETFPNADILATDISPVMLAVAKENLVDLPNVRYQLADGEHIQLEERFDFIVSNAAFQWFNDYTQAFKGFYKALNEDGRLIFATFGEGTFCELHHSFKAAEQALDCFPGEHVTHGPIFISEQNLQSACLSAGFNLFFRTEDFREYFPSVRNFLVSVKKVGANNNTNSEVNFNRRMMLGMMNYYESNYRLEDKIYATYNIVYGVAKKD